VTTHASRFIAKPEEFETGPMVALTGSQRYLKRGSLEALRTVVLGSPDEEATVFSGKDAALSDVLDELSLISMWGDRRLVVVEDADEFVTNFRGQLEKYLEQPAKKSVLVLDVKKWNKSTRLAKAVLKAGLTIACEDLKGRELQSWMTATAKDKFGKQLTRESAVLIEQLVGINLGLIEQELSKLSSYAGDRKSIEQQDVRALVGGWKTETTWKMLDCLRDGKLGESLELLDNLLNAGEHPLKLLGGINYVYRKYVLAAEWARQGTPLGESLRNAKVFPNAVEASGKYLRPSPG
jgi:DNA polymerase-3 subunit delta